MSGLMCPVCGVIAVERADDTWQQDEEIDCPCCATTLQVEMDEDGTEVWAVEIEAARAAKEG